MALAQRIAEATRVLLGVSGYNDTAPVTGLEIDSAAVEAARKALGGQLQPLPTTRPRWYLADVETAQYRADSGDLQMAAQLWRASKTDGLIGGLRRTLSSGLVALPKRFRGSPEAISDLRADNGTRSLFDEMLPASELAKMADDAVGLGASVGVLQEVRGRDFPVLIRLEPEYLSYRWSEDRWYYRSVAGPLAIHPGDSRWVLHVDGGRFAPWNDGVWQSVGNAYITKTHSKLNRQNYGNKLANPARIAKAPSAATELQRTGFLSALLAWGINTVLELPPGWDASLLESNGRGWEVFGADIETADFDAMISLAGQVVTVTGGSGFANADIHRVIRADLIRLRAEALALTINTQILPPWAIKRYGIDTVLENPAKVSWDAAPPADRKTEAEALGAVGDAITKLKAAIGGGSSAAVPPGAPFGPKPPGTPGAAPPGAPKPPGDEESSDEQDSDEKPPAPGDDSGELSAALEPPEPDADLDVLEILNRFGIPVKGDEDGDSADPPAFDPPAGSKA